MELQIFAPKPISNPVIPLSRQLWHIQLLLHILSCFQVYSNQQDGYKYWETNFDSSRVFDMLKNGAEKQRSNPHQNQQKYSKCKQWETIINHVLSLPVYQLIYKLKSDHNLVIKSVILFSIHAPKRSIPANTPRIFGTKVSVCSWIDVTVWKILIIYNKWY